MNFFNESPNALVFTEYGSYHSYFIITFLVICLLTILFSNKIRNWKYEWVLRLLPFIITFVLEIAFKIWELYRGEHFIGAVITFDLCAISLYSSWVLLYNKNENLFRVLYFFALGAVVSIILPAFGTYGPDHFRFYHYFIVHFFIIWAQLYFIVVYKYSVRFKDLLRTYAYLSVIATLVLLFNIKFGTNFMYLLERPDISTPLDLLGDWPYFMFGLVGLVIVLFAVIYLPWLFVKKKKLKTT